MAKNTRAIDIWKQMRPSSLRRLSIAVFLMFSALGPITILMESSLRLVPWIFVLTQSISLGGFAATIVLFGRKKWWITMAIVFIWSMIISLNSGGLTLTIGDEGVRVRLGSSMGVQDASEKNRLLKPDQGPLDSIYTQRGLLGSLSILLIAFGYISFIRLMRKEVSERARLETEVKIAQEIQQSLLPPPLFDRSWLTIGGLTIPATEVGGDFFDIIPLSEDRVAVAVADVTGHGVGAGILSAMTKSAFHGELLHNSSPAELLSNINRTMYELSKEKMFVTFAYLLLDRSSREAVYATAGHPPLFLRRGTTGKIEPLRTTNIGLGIKDQYQFSAERITLMSGDQLLLYTDGVLEAMNVPREQFGSDRLISCLESPHTTPGGLCENIHRAVKDFTRADTFQDDITLVAVFFR